MATLEEVAFRIAVDGAQAKRELGEIRQQATSLGGGLDRVKGGLERLDKAAGASTGKGLRAMQFALGGVSSKASEAVGVVGDLAGMLVSGGVAGAAFAAGAFAAVKLAEAYGEAEANSRVFGESTKSTIDFIRQQAVVGLDEYRAKVEDMERAVRNFGKTQNEVFIEGIEIELEQARSSKLNLDANIGAIRERAKIANEEAAALRGSKYQEEAALANAILANAEARLKAVESRLPALQSALDRAYAADVAGLRQAGGQAPTARASGDGPGGLGDVLAMRTSGGDGGIFKKAAALQLAMDKQMKDMLLTNEKQWNELRLNEQKRADDEANWLHETSLKKRLADESAFASAAMDLTKKAIVDPMMAATSTGIGVFQDYLDMKIQGEKDAELQATAAFMKGIGSQLIGIGTRSLFEGGAKLFNPVTAPIGVAEMAFGGGAIAAGIGLGAAGTAITHTAAGGTVGKALPSSSSSAATDRGVNYGRSGGRSSGGEGAVINIVYSAAGPAPEDTGREVQRVLDVHRRRVGAR